MIHFTSAAPEAALLSIALKVWLLPQAVYKPTMVVIAFKQIMVFAPLKKRICMFFENSLIEWTLNLTSPHYIFLESLYYEALLSIWAYHSPITLFKFSKPLQASTRPLSEKAPISQNLN
jgi:hypothetical protein